MTDVDRIERPSKDADKGVQTLLARCQSRRRAEPEPIQSRSEGGDVALSSGNRWCARRRGTLALCSDVAVTEYDVFLGR